MLPQAALLSALDKIKGVSLRKTWYRIGDLSYLLDGDDPLSGAGSKYASGRFHRKGDVLCVYLAGDPVTAVIEGCSDPKIVAPRLLIAVEVQLSNVLDLCDERNHDMLGTTLQELTGSWKRYENKIAPTQRLGYLAAEGKRFEGIRYQSAKETGYDSSLNLVVFLDNIAENSLTIWDPDNLLPRAKAAPACYTGAKL